MHYDVIIIDYYLSGIYQSGPSDSLLGQPGPVCTENWGLLFPGQE